MKNDVYTRLMDHLTTVGMGIAKTNGLRKILVDNLTPEEAEMAIGLPSRLPPLEVQGVDLIAEKLSKPEEEVAVILEGLSKKGFLYKRPVENGKLGYAFIQPNYGIPQMLYWNGKRDDRAVKGALPLVMNMAAGQKNEAGPTSFRYFPVSRAVNSINTAILPYDRVEELVKNTHRAALVHCACRELNHVLYSSTSIIPQIFEKVLLGKKTDCTHTVENCLKFDEMADFVLEKGLGREISTDEALDIIKKSENEGLIHFVDNRQDGIHHVCNCCSCCCWHLNLIKKGVSKRDETVITYYLRETDTEKCNGCGACVKDCPLGYVKMKDGLPEVNLDKCAGCGLCLRHCGKKAATLKKRDDNIPPETFETLYDMRFKALEEKQKR